MYSTYFFFQRAAMLKNVVGLVTGGASGLGKATVERSGNIENNSFCQKKKNMPRH